ncbi:hypothetical protein H0H93_006993 [Arthromyces matolae]|nr:hypothetical protein H0H93_006993 [Arthromyces matolae]
MTTRPSAIPFLGALGVTLTTVAVGYYTYKYLRRPALSRLPRQPSSHSNIYVSPTPPQTQSIEPANQNSVPPVQPPSDRFVPPLQQPLAHNSFGSAPPPYSELSPPQPIGTPPEVSRILRQEQPLSPVEYDDPLPEAGPSRRVTQVGPTSANEFSGNNLSTQPPPQTWPRLFRSEAINPGYMSKDPYMNTNDNWDGERLTFSEPSNCGSSEDDELPLEGDPQHESQPSINDDIRDRLSEGQYYRPEQLAKRFCRVSMDKSKQIIKIGIRPPAMKARFDAKYERCIAKLNNLSHDVEVHATVERMDAVSLFSYIRLRKALEHLANDDTNHRCRSLHIELSESDKIVTSEYPDLLPLTLPELQTLTWESRPQQLHLMGLDNLNCLTKLTLKTVITPPDCLYLLHKLSGTLRECHLQELDRYCEDVFPEPSSATVHLDRIESFSIVAFSCPVDFLNRLEFHHQRLKALSIIGYSNVRIDPAEIKSIPWAVIQDIRVDCHFVPGGVDWIERQAVQAVQAESCVLIQKFRI